MTRRWGRANPLGTTVVCALVLSAAVLSGCSPETSREAGTDTSVWGYVASPADARIQVDTSASSLVALVAERVTAPADSWLVVYSDVDGSPGRVLGLTRVPQGESSARVVKFAGGAPRDVFVVMHADMGKAGTFEFDPKNKAQSPDRAIFVDGRQLAVKVRLRDYGVKTTAAAASITVWPQLGITSTITVAEVVAPADAWVVVHLDEKGTPGPVLGHAWVPAGRTGDVAVRLSEHAPTGGLWVVLHADRGQSRVFEFAASDPLGSADQAFMVDGKEVVVQVPLE